MKNAADNARLKVSLVIPTYGRETCILELLPQLISQDFPKDSYEILIIDQTGYRSHQFLELVSHPAVSIKHIILPVPSIAHAWNVGISKAAGEVLVFIDDDVRVTNNFLENHLMVYAGDSGCVAVAGQVLSPGELPRFTRHQFSRLPDVGWCFFPLSYAYQAPIDVARGCNFSFRRDIAIQAGGIDEQYEKSAHCFEPEFCFRLRKFGRIIFDPRPVVFHKSYPEGGIRNNDSFSKAENDLRGALYFMVRALPVFWWPLFLLSEFRRNVFLNGWYKHPRLFYGYLKSFCRAVTGSVSKIKNGPKYFIKGKE